MLRRSNKVTDVRSTLERKGECTHNKTISQMATELPGKSSPWSFINMASSCSPLSQPPHYSSSSRWVRNHGLFTGCLSAELISVSSDTILWECYRNSAKQAQPACSPHQGEGPYPSPPPDNQPVSQSLLRLTSWACRAHECCRCRINGDR